MSSVPPSEPVQSVRLWLGMLGLRRSSTLKNPPRLFRDQSESGEHRGVGSHQPASPSRAAAKQVAVVTEPEIEPRMHQKAAGPDADRIIQRPTVATAPCRRTRGSPGCPAGIPTGPAPAPRLPSQAVRRSAAPRQAGAFWRPCRHWTPNRLTDYCGCRCGRPRNDTNRTGDRCGGRADRGRYGGAWHGKDAGLLLGGQSRRLDSRLLHRRHHIRRHIPPDLQPADRVQARHRRSDPRPCGSPGT